MNEYVKRYKKYRKEHRPLESYAMAARTVAFHGTLNDLKAIEQAYWNEITESEVYGHGSTRELAKVSGQ